MMLLWLRLQRARVLSGTLKLMVDFFFVVFGMVLAAQKPVNPYMPPTKDDPEVKNDARKLHEAIKRKSKGWEVNSLFP